MTEIIVGSVAFFNGVEGFEPKVTDKVAIVPQVKNGWWQHVSTKDGVRIFHWQEHTVAELVEKLSLCTDCKRISTLLVPEFAQAVMGKMSVTDYLDAVYPLLSNLCGKHLWVGHIYAAYKYNGALTLTDEQKAEAYEAYRKVRPEKNEAAKHKEAKHA